MQPRSRCCGAQGAKQLEAFLLHFFCVNYVAVSQAGPRRFSACCFVWGGGTLSDAPHQREDFKMLEPEHAK